MVAVHEFIHDHCPDPAALASALSLVRLADAGNPLVRVRRAYDFSGSWYLLSAPKCEHFALIEIRPAEVRLCAVIHRDKIGWELSQLVKEFSA